MEYAIEIM